MIGYTTEAQKAADVARLEREIAEDTAALEAAKAAKVLPDLTEAMQAYLHALPTGFIVHPAALIAAYPALHKVLGSATAAYGKVHTDGSRSGGQPVAPEPTEAEDLAMARSIACDWLGDLDSGMTGLALAAIKAERQRAGGGK